MVKISLTGPLKGKTIVLAKRYPFTNGVMEIANDDNGAVIYRYLKKYYAVTTGKIKDEVKPVVSDHVPTGNQTAGAGNN